MPEMELSPQAVEQQAAIGAYDYVKAWEEARKYPPGCTVLQDGGRHQGGGEGWAGGDVVKYDKYEYIRNYYRVPARKNAPVKYKDRHGVVTGTSGPHVMIKLNGDAHARPYHPTDENLTWLDAS